VCRAHHPTRGNSAVRHQLHSENLPGRPGERAPAHVRGPFHGRAADYLRSFPRALASVIPVER